MKSWVLQALFGIRYSYWFIPSLMALGALGLAITMVALDIYVMTDIPEGYEWLFRSQPSGARAILSTVAGSTITVAGVVFSMTIMAVSHATSNYGSRLLLKFLKDRRNQIALGTFTATFIYCLLVLRTVSNADSGSEYSGFVPHLAVLGALGMALASVAVLIAFIHHVPDTIHIGDVASDRGRELTDRLNDLFPQPDTESEDTPDTGIALDLTASLSQEVKSTQSGYLQTLDVEGLLKYCAQHKLVAQVLKPTGDFVNRGEPILIFAAGDNDSDHIDDLQRYMGLGSERTPAQDVRFLVEELSQIAIRALSPGINDPFTAITCIDWLGSAVAQVIDRPARASDLRDDDQVLRVRLPAFEFSDLCAYIFNQLQPYVVDDITTSLHMAKVFKSIIICSSNKAHQQIIIDYASDYHTEALERCDSDAGQALLSDAYSGVISS